MWQKNEINRNMTRNVTAGNHESGRTTVEQSASLRLESMKVAEQP